MRARFCLRAILADILHETIEEANFHIGQRFGGAYGAERFNIVIQNRHQLRMQKTAINFAKHSAALGAFAP
jgi:hypothetical protein